MSRYNGRLPVSDLQGNWGQRQPVNNCFLSDLSGDLLEDRAALLQPGAYFSIVWSIFSIGYNDTALIEVLSDHSLPGKAKKPNLVQLNLICGNTFSPMLFSLFVSLPTSISLPLTYQLLMHS